MWETVKEQAQEEDGAIHSLSRPLWALLRSQEHARVGDRGNNY